MGPQFRISNVWLGHPTWENKEYRIMKGFGGQILPLRLRSGLKAPCAQNDNKRDTVLVAAWGFGLTGIVGLSILLVENMLWDLQDGGRVRKK